MFERLKRWLQSGSAVVPGNVAVEAKGTPLVSSAALIDTVGDTTRIMVIDVRSEREFLAAAIESAVNLPLPQLEHRIRELVTDTATPLALYCASGARSGIACMMLKQLGYSNVVNAGGLYAAAAQLQLELRR